MNSKTISLKKELSGLENLDSQLEAQVANLERTLAGLQSKFILLAKRKREADIEKGRMENTLNSGVTESDDIKGASWAVPPEKKIGPKRVVGTLEAGIAGCLIFILIAFFQNYMVTATRTTSKS